MSVIQRHWWYILKEHTTRSTNNSKELPSKQSSKRSYKTSLKELLVPHMQRHFKMDHALYTRCSITFIHFYVTNTGMVTWWINNVPPVNKSSIINSVFSSLYFLYNWNSGGKPQDQLLVLKKVSKMFDFLKIFTTLAPPFWSQHHLVPLVTFLPRFLLI